MDKECKECKETVVTLPICDVRHSALQDAQRLQKEIFEARFRAADQALVLRTSDIERRLEGLNQLRSEVVKDREQFVRKESYDEKHMFLEEKLNTQGTRLTIMETRSVVWTAAIGMFFVIVQLAMFYFHSISKPVFEYEMKQPTRIEAPSRN